MRRKTVNPEVTEVLTELDIERLLARRKKLYEEMKSINAALRESARMLPSGQFVVLNHRGAIRPLSEEEVERLLNNEPIEREVSKSA